MKQRDIFLTRFDPVTGSEQGGIRPAVIISGDSLNQAMDVCIMCPVSSKIKNYPGCFIIRKDEKNGLKKDSEIMTFQVRVISKNRILKKIGVVSTDELQKIKQNLFDILTY
jgi:mRNA interferase MazF